MFQEFDDDFLIKRRITNNEDYPPSEARYLSVKEYILALEEERDELREAFDELCVP